MAADSGLRTPDERLALAAAPRGATAPFEVGFAGHAAGDAVKDALTPPQLAAIRDAGFAARLREPAIARWLHHVPIPLEDPSEFDALFPDTVALDVEAPDAEGGRFRPWLRAAVRDFFAAGGERCWVVRVPEHPSGDLPPGWGGPRPSEGVPRQYHRFVPLASAEALARDPASLHGVAALLVLPEIGLIAMPDLERLAIPPQSESLAPAAEPDPVPAFRPLGESPAPRIIEPPSFLLDAFVPPAELYSILTTATALLGRVRPDVQLLFTLPLGLDRRDGVGAAAELATRLPTVAAEGSDRLAIRGEDGEGVRLAAERSLGADWFRLAPIWPFLRRPDGQLRSAVGAIAGMTAAGVALRGAWSSIAGVTVRDHRRPWPAPRAWDVPVLREAGLGVLVARDDGWSLDDERFLAASPGARVDGPGPGYAQSVEAARLVGWLMRQLRRLGERAVFDLDPNDSAPELMIRDFLGRLAEAGALDGGPGRPAFALRRLPAPDTTLIFEIEIRPALPIDAIVLTLSLRPGAVAVTLDSEALDGAR